jgi:NAD(P)-dependent dehydrogenase (short-subunit alcohol dehydrogenase family)
MAKDKDDRTVLVTGAARDSAGSSLDLAAGGWRVGVHYRALRPGRRLRPRSNGMAGSRCLALISTADALPADRGLRRPRRALPHHQRRRFEPDTLATLDGATWQAQLDVNLRAPVFLTQAFARTLPDGMEGNVINIVDQKVLRLTPDYFSYTIAKAALWSATQMMAQALAPKIRVNAIAPGPVLKHEGQSRSTFERECSATPLQRAVSAEDVAGAVRFLTAPSITGQIIALDSGQHLAFDAESGA